MHSTYLDHILANAALIYGHERKIDVVLSSNKDIVGRGTRALLVDYVEETPFGQLKCVVLMKGEEGKSDKDALAKLLRRLKEEVHEISGLLQSYE